MWQHGSVVLTSIIRSHSCSICNLNILYMMKCHGIFLRHRNTLKSGRDRCRTPQAVHIRQSTRCWELRRLDLSFAGSANRIWESIYQDLDATYSCFKILNGTHEFGCKGEYSLLGNCLLVQLALILFWPPVAKQYASKVLCDVLLHWKTSWFSYPKGTSKWMFSFSVHPACLGIGFQSLLEQLALLVLTVDECQMPFATCSYMTCTPKCVVRVCML